MNIELLDVTKTFPEKTVLKDFSYRFENKGLYAVLGDSGSGKTTLLRLIAGLDLPTSGSIKKDGKISCCFQEYRLFSHLSALENITKIVSEKPSSELIEKAKEMLLYLGFTEKDMSLHPSALSGGMKQRVNFLRSVLFPANILLLDEPFKELDDFLCRKIAKLIENEAENKTVIMVVHDLDDFHELKPIIIDLNEKARQ